MPLLEATGLRRFFDLVLSGHVLQIQPTAQLWIDGSHGLRTDGNGSNANPTPYHIVRHIRSTLLRNGCNRCGREIERTRFVDQPARDFERQFRIERLIDVRPFYIDRRCHRDATGRVDDIADFEARFLSG